MRNAARSCGRAHESSAAVPPHPAGRQQLGLILQLRPLVLNVDTAGEGPHRGHGRQLASPARPDTAAREKAVSDKEYGVRAHPPPREQQAPQTGLGQRA